MHNQPVPGSVPANAAATAFPAGVLSVAQIDHLLDVNFPQIHLGGRVFFIEGAGVRRARMRMAAHEKNLRPGNTLSGPSMFQLADVALYVAILATLGETAMQAVTTNLNINFLSRPQPGDLVADATLVKVGKRLLVGEVEMFSVGADDMVSHAIGTYAMPVRGRP